MTLAGVRNVAAEQGLDRWGSLSMETLLRSAPELIVLTGYRASQPSLANVVLEHPALRRVRADAPDDDGSRARTGRAACRRASTPPTLLQQRGRAMTRCARPRRAPRTERLTWPHSACSHRRAGRGRVVARRRPQQRRTDVRFRRARARAT